MGCAAGSTLLFTRIDVRGLSGNSRRLILERVKSKLGLTKADELLGTSSRGLLHNIHGIWFCQGYVKSKRIEPAKACFIIDLR